MNSIKLNNDQKIIQIKINHGKERQNNIQRQKIVCYQNQALRKFTEVLFKICKLKTVKPLCHMLKKIKCKQKTLENSKEKDQNY